MHLRFKDLFSFFKHRIFKGGAHLHQFDVHGHVDGEEHVDGVRLPQDQGVLQRETWTGISGQCLTLPIFENS